MPITRSVGEYWVFQFEIPTGVHELKLSDKTIRRIHYRMMTPGRRSKLDFTISSNSLFVFELVPYDST